MPGFDIESLLAFQPARNWCPTCLALWESFSLESFILDNKKDYKAFIIEGRNNNVLRCKVCGVKYVGIEATYVGT